MRFAPLFIIASVLAAVIFGLDYVLALYLQPFFLGGSTGGTNSFELYSFIESVISFLLSPVVSFLVFYKIGSRVLVKTLTDHFRVLTSAFTGGLVGSVVPYFGFVAYLWLTGGTAAPFGPDTNWLVSVAQPTLGLLRGGIDFAFLAFAGVIIGDLRSSKNQSANPIVPAHSDETSAQAVLNDSPQPHVETALGLFTTNPPPMSFSDL